MNKTVNINLANMLFHMDENAYNKMQRYLEAIKRSFANTPGSDEILADIEARIAELFTEKMENERQVITLKEVDAIITIMGQPEDYQVDEDIFDDAPRPKQSRPTRSKKLYRDTDNKYVAGVSAGLGHYLGLDPIWVRLLWIVLTLGSGGGFIILYIVLWILVPEATTTSQKLDMSGKPVNISNIEHKVKEGFADVADKVKNVDYGKVKSSSKTFFDTVGDVFMFLFKVFAKLMAILFVIIGGASLIGLFIAAFSVGILNAVNVPGIDFLEMVNVTHTPVWLASLLVFFAAGIPMFFVMYLGLRILVKNLHSIGNIAKFTLLGLWLVSLITLIVLGVRQAAAFAYSGSVTERQELPMASTVDTLHLSIVPSETEEHGDNRGFNGMVFDYDTEGNEVLVINDTRFYIKSSRDNSARIEVRKRAYGDTFANAKEMAAQISYGFSLEDNVLYLDNFITAPTSGKYRDQQARINLFIPKGMYLDFENDVYDCYKLRFDTKPDVRQCSLDEYTWKMGANGILECQDCPEEDQEDDDWDEDTPHDRKVTIDGNGIDIDVEDGAESFQMKIDGNGVKIRATDEDADKVDIQIDENRSEIKTETAGDSLLIGMAGQNTVQKAPQKTIR